MAQEGDGKASLEGRGSHGQVGGKVFSSWEVGLALSLATGWGSPAGMAPDEAAVWGWGRGAGGEGGRL